MTRTPIIAAVLLLALAATAQAEVQVTISDDGRGARRIASYIERLGERYLEPGEDVKIEILDFREGRDRDRWIGRHWGHRPWHYGPG